MKIGAKEAQRRALRELTFDPLPPPAARAKRALEFTPVTKPIVTKVGRPRKFTSDADRQRAYRQRKRSS